MNAIGTFSKGAKLWVGGRAATVLEAHDPTKALVALAGGDEPTTIDLIAAYESGSLQWVPPVTEKTEPPPLTLEQISEPAWTEARRREAIIRPLLTPPRNLAKYKEVAESTGASLRSLFRWVAAHDQNGLRGLVPDVARRGGAGKTRLDEAREALLKDCIQRFYLRRTRPTLREALPLIVAEFREKGLQPPTMKTFRARLAAWDVARKTTDREGSKKGRRHTVSRGAFPGGTRPLQTILIDHTPLDLQIVDSADRTRVIGRPFLSLAIDACTRMIFGYYLSLDPPSYHSIAMCILQGVMPKESTLKAFDLQHPWPIYGLPETIHTDNGKDFRSTHLERFCAQYEIAMEFRPVRTPQYGGLIERAIGTINRFVHALPGTTKSSVAEKGEYDAEAGATFTVEEIEAFLARRIVEHYHTAIHRELGKSPVAVWEEALKAGTFSPTLPPDAERFRIDLLPFKERTIQKDGLAIFGLHYTDGVLQTWRSRSGAKAAEAKYLVKYDPRDLSRVYFITPEGAAIPIPLANRSLGSFSLLELRRSQALATAAHRTWSERTFPEMLQRERAALAEAEKKSKAAKRDAARIRRTREAVAKEAPKNPSPASSVHAVDLSSEDVTPPPPAEVTDSSATPLVSPASADDDWGTPIIFARGDR